MRKKQYGPPDQYEKKLTRVMDRLGAEEYKFNWDRWSGWVQFKYKGKLFEFEYSTEKAQKKGIDIKYGSDAFAIVVLTLEDLARMTERGTYDIFTGETGLKMLGPAKKIPNFFKDLGYEKIPEGPENIRARFRNLAKKHHPDRGGSPSDFNKIRIAYENALQYFMKTGDDNGL